MSAIGLRARRALVDLIGRVVAGGAPGDAERRWIESEIALSGFRRAALGYLIRRSAQGALEQGDVTLIAPALGSLFRIACSATDLGVGWTILQTGTYEPHIVELYRRTLKPGMTVADIGANIGFHALHAASLVGPAGRVIAVEPDPRSAALLGLSRSLNDAAPRIEVIEAALSDAAGELIHSDLGNAGNSGARFTHDDRARLEGLVHGVDPQFRSVRALRWDDDHGDVRLDFVKIDIEGFEPRALRGMEGSLARHRPIILSEYAPSNLRSLGGVDPPAYLAWIVQRGYRASIVEEPGGGLQAASERSLAAALAGKHHIDLLFEPVRRAP